MSSTDKEVSVQKSQISMLRVIDRAKYLNHHQKAISNVRTLIDGNGKKQLWLKTEPKVGYRLEDDIVTQASTEDLGCDLQSPSQPSFEVDKKHLDSIYPIDSNKRSIRRLPAMNKENTVFLLIFILVTSLSWAGIAFYKTTQGGETTTYLPSIVYKINDCVIYSYTSDITETLINRVQEAVITHHLKLIAIMIEERYPVKSQRLAKSTLVGVAAITSALTNSPQIFLTLEKRTFL